ncbi:hypothetical protein BFRIG_01864 [Peribacillus frigoritolerans]
MGAFYFMERKESSMKFAYHLSKLVIKDLIDLVVKLSVIKKCEQIVKG